MSRNNVDPLVCVSLSACFIIVCGNVKLIYQHLTHVLSLRLGQVRALLEHVDAIKGQILDICGAAGDAVQMVLTEQGLRVFTNDLNRW